MCSSVFCRCFLSNSRAYTEVRTGLFIQSSGVVLYNHNDLDNINNNNNIRTNHIKARIDKTQQNSKCRLCGDRDETINHIISECSKLALKEYKARHDCVDKVIHWEMCKNFKFDHTNKWYMHVVHIPFVVHCTTQHLS